MKRNSISAILSCIVLLISSFCFAACDKNSEALFIETNDDGLVGHNGEKYEFLANEGVLYYNGKISFEGCVKDETPTFNHLGVEFKNGVYSIDGDSDKNILIRYSNSEWFSAYRKASLPEFDFCVDNCNKFEYIPLNQNNNTGLNNTSDNVITNKAEIIEFLSDVRNQDNPKEAGLYDLVSDKDGNLINCYRCGTIVGHFEEEPYLLVCMSVTSYNDLAYSVSIDNEEYVLPSEWFHRFCKNT